MDIMPTIKKNLKNCLKNEKNRIVNICESSVSQGSLKSSVCQAGARQK